MHLPSPWIKSPSVFEVVMIHVHGSKRSKDLHTLWNCITFKCKIIKKKYRLKINSMFFLRTLIAALYRDFGSHL